MTRRPPTLLILFLLFTVFPLVELFLLVWLTIATSFWFTLAVVILSGAIGAYMARRDGIATWQKVNQEFAAGRFPGKHLMDALIILVGGTLLITPGLITDVIGFSTLVPACRSIYRSWILKRLTNFKASGTKTHYGKTTVYTFGGGSAKVYSASQSGWQEAPQQENLEGDESEIYQETETPGPPFKDSSPFSRR